MNFLEVCQKFISIDSSPNQGNREIAEYCAELCEGAGLRVELQQESLGGVPQSNIIARPSESRPEEELLLQAPLDTIDPGSFGLWSMTDHNPYSATIRDGLIYGLGANRGKLDFVCKLKAIESLGPRRLKKPFVLTGTYGSETGMAGAVQLVRRKKVSAKMALIGGASNLRALHASKGMVTVEILVPFSEQERKFRARHDKLESSSSQSKMFMAKDADADGGNAIVKMIHYLSQLPSGISVLHMDGGANKNTKPSYASLEFDLASAEEHTIAGKVLQIMKAVAHLEDEFKKHHDPNFDPPFPTINIGTVRTHQEHLLFSGTCHVPPSVDPQDYERWMERLKAACEKEGAVFRITEYIQPYRTPLDSGLVRAVMEGLEQLKLDYTPAACPRSTEANIFSRFGMDCILFGAGREAGAAQIPNECVAMADLEAATLFYEKVLSRLCL